MALTVLVAAVTGYVSGRLLQHLRVEGHPDRVLRRSASRARDVPRAAQVEVHEPATAMRRSTRTGTRALSEPLTDACPGGAVYVDERRSTVAARPEDLWAVVEGIGGANGWYSVPLAWTARGLLDRLVGGVGLRRGRRHPRHLSVGEPLDWWRVEEVEPGRLLRLRAEMRLPGRAWLELAVEEQDGRTVFTQRALFRPRGLAGHAYWRSVAPFHGIVFGRMIRNITGEAERASAARPS